MIRFIRPENSVGFTYKIRFYFIKRDGNIFYKNKPAYSQIKVNEHDFKDTKNKPQITSEKGVWELQLDEEETEPGVSIIVADLGKIKMVHKTVIVFSITEYAVGHWSPTKTPPL